MGRFLKFVLLLVVIAAALIAYLFYKTPAATVTLADLEKGGSFSDTERTALVSACTARLASVKKEGADKICGCIADKATSGFSRYDRAVMTASFRLKLSEAVAEVKGLIASGIAADQIKAAEEGASARIKEMMKTCNAE